MNDLPNSHLQSAPMQDLQTVSWIHIGDLHMVRAGEQNEIDLGRTVDTINRLYADGSVNFVFLPGDIADDGSAAAYRVVRSNLDRLKAPWFGIVGDHDVHEKSFANFQDAISESLYDAFSLGSYRFLRLNAFSQPRPDSFTLDPEQLRWLREELQACANRGWSATLFLHCYPSELKDGAEELRQLIEQYPVLLVDMGHTHYNEISNDGTALYTATRSTGQIEEGPMGFSLTTLDNKVVSWHFLQPEERNVVVITYPADRRLQTSRTPELSQAATIEVRAKVWSSAPVSRVQAELHGRSAALHSAGAGHWSGEIDRSGLSDGVHRLSVTATGANGTTFSSAIEVNLGPIPLRHIAPVDHDNAIGEWRERGLLGTQLGPNKNGKKW